MLDVIGTGFGRTGTSSMRDALNILGFGPCHHMSEVIADQDQARLWYDAIGVEDPDWGLLLSGYRSCVDWPSARYWPQLVAKYPDARVILTWRSAESWWASFEKTILQHILEYEDSPPPTDDRVRPGAKLICGEVFHGRARDRDYAISVYEANVAAVRATVPAERLLVHAYGDGWEPLCAHLRVPVPDVPYPRRNSTAEFIAGRTKRQASE